MRTTLLMIVEISSTFLALNELLTSSISVVRRVEIERNFCFGPTDVLQLIIASVRIESGIEERFRGLVAIGVLIYKECLRTFFNENSFLLLSS